MLAPSPVSAPRKAQQGMVSAALTQPAPGSNYYTDAYARTEENNTAHKHETEQTHDDELDTDRTEAINELLAVAGNALGCR